MVFYYNPTFQKENKPWLILFKFPNKASCLNKLKPNNVILPPGTERYKFSYINNRDYNPSGNIKLQLKLFQMFTKLHCK